MEDKWSSKGAVYPFVFLQGVGFFVVPRTFFDSFIRNWPDGPPGKSRDEMSGPRNSPAQIATNVALFLFGKPEREVHAYVKQHY